LERGHEIFKSLQRGPRINKVGNHCSKWNRLKLTIDKKYKFDQFIDEEYELEKKALIIQI
jgi:hypothetical protein